MSAEGVNDRVAAHYGASAPHATLELPYNPGEDMPEDS
jgi:hypothetical protein